MYKNKKMRVLKLCLFELIQTQLPRFHLKNVVLMVVLVPRCIVGSLSVFASVDQDGREYFVEGLELNTR